MINADLGAVVVAAGIGMGGEDRARHNAEHLRAIGRHEVDALVPRQAKLRVVFGIGAEVLADGAEFGWPGIEIEIGYG
jgi:hypothetical protein